MFKKIHEVREVKKGTARQEERIKREITEINKKARARHRVLTKLAKQRLDSDVAYVAIPNSRLFKYDQEWTLSNTKTTKRMTWRKCLCVDVSWRIYGPGKNSVGVRCYPFDPLLSPGLKASEDMAEDLAAALNHGRSLRRLEE